MKYNFPVKDLYLARTVLQPDFDIFNYPDLYVNLDAIRINSRFQDYRRNIKRALNLDENTGQLKPLIENNYPKILFTGFRGSGKTTELKKLQQELSGPDKYYTVFIELEQEYNITRFQFEDFYFIIFYNFSKLVNNDPALKKVSGILDELIRDLISDKQIEEEIRKRSSISLGGGGSLGANLLKIFRANVDIKTEFSTSSKIAEKIRTTIKRRLGEIIDNFNEKIRHIRNEIRRQNKGRDILFILDGLEKVPLDIYDQLIVKDNYALRNINASIITAIPIEAQYLADKRVVQDMFTTFLLPVIRVDDPHNRFLMSQVVSRRIDIETFFESEKVLDYLVLMSGGLIRQLFKLVSYCLLYGSNYKITLDEAKELVQAYGQSMFEYLNSKQIKLLKDFKAGKKKIIPANNDDGVLLYNSFLLKHNGHYIINPVIEDFLNEARR